MNKPLQTPEPIDVTAVGKAGAFETATVWKTKKPEGGKYRFFFTTIRPSLAKHVALVAGSGHSKVKGNLVPIFDGSTIIQAWELEVKDLEGAREVLRILEAQTPARFDGQG